MQPIDILFKLTQNIPIQLNLMDNELNKINPDKVKLKKNILQIRKILIQNSVKDMVPKSKSSFGSSGTNYTSLIIIAIAVFLFYYLKKKGYFKKMF